MTNVAALGVEATMKGVVETAKGLDNLTNSAAKAEAAAQGVTTGTTAAAAATEKVAVGANGAAAALQREATSAQNAARALQIHGTAANRAAVATAGFSGQTGNIAAQFQDIGVQLAGGQSPFLIALQQGTQLSSVLGATGGGLRGVLSALGAGFASLLSPVSLLTIGFIAAGGALVQYFMSAADGGAKSEETLAKQEALIGRVVDKWGEAYPAIKAYNDELERTRTEAELAAAIDIVKGDKIRPVNDLIEELNVNIGNWREQLQNAGMDSVVFDDLQRKLQASSDQMRDGKSESEALASAMGVLRGGIEDQSNPALIAMIDLLGQLQKAASNAAGAIAEITPSSFPGRPEFTTANDAPDARFQLPGTGPNPGTRPLYELEGPYSVSSGGGSKQSAYDSALKSMQEQTRALEAQNAVQSTLNPLVNDYGFALTRAKAATDLLLAAERDKKTVTPELTADINAQATALANATVEQNKNAEAISNAKANMEAVKGAATGFLSTMRQGLVAGEGWWKSFGNAALSVLDKVASAIETQLVNALFSTSGGGFNILSLFGLGASAFPAAPNAGLGGVIGGNSLPAAGAKMAARLPAAKQAVRAEGQGFHITVGLTKGQGLNIEPEVVEISRTEAGRAAGQVKANFDGWRKNGFHNDVETHMKNRRKIG